MSELALHYRYTRPSLRPSHTARVMRALGTAIVSGHYPQGTVLPSDAELMAQFGVSRTVLREAMKTLAGKGLLLSKTRIGTTVRDRAAWNLFDADVLIWYAEVGFDADFITHLGEMRLALEPEAAALAARRHTAEQLPRLYGWIERMGANGVSKQQFVDADLGFHLEVATVAANPFLKSISTLIEVALVAALSRSSPVDNLVGLKNSVARHKAIVDAIAADDADAARLAMRGVILEGIDRAAGIKTG